MNLQGFGHTFPFPMICTENVKEWRHVSRTISDIDVDILPPFHSGSDDGILPSFAMNAAPGFRRRKIKWPADKAHIKGPRVLPTLQPIGEKNITNQIETNSLQIEFITKNEQTAERIESWLIHAAMRNLRRATKQYWIRQTAVYLEGTKRLKYEVKNEKLNPSIWEYTTTFTASQKVKIIDENIWRNSWKSAKEEYMTDYFDNLLLAEHHKATGYHIDCIFNLSLSIERAKYILWEKFLKNGLGTKASFKAASNDTHKPERYFRELLPNETNFSIAGTTIEDTIKQVWKTRGLIAHGKEKEIRKISGNSLDLERLNVLIDDIWSLGELVSNYQSG